MEQEFIASLRERVSRQKFSQLVLGIGDDAAVLDPGNRRTVVTVDLLTEGVDFLVAKNDPRLIGRKALAVNLSDLAAMGAVPTGILIAGAVPRENSATPLGLLTPKELLEHLFTGIENLATEFELPIIGGDTNSWDQGLVLSITALGATTPRGPLLRSGAKAGDRICVTGTLGGSFLEHQFTFTPRVRESLLLNERYEIHAAMDISDGLSLDLHRLCTESKVDAIVYENEIPISADAKKLSQQERDGAHFPLHGVPLSPLEHALRDGEDFELLFTCDAETALRLSSEQPLKERFGTKITVLGEMTVQKASTPTIWLQDSSGRRETLAPRGFTH